MVFDYKAYFLIGAHRGEYFIIQKEHILRESENLLLYCENESVSLCFKKLDLPLIHAGYHYGNPVDALISRDEKYVVTVGHGLEIYFIDDNLGSEREPRKESVALFREKGREWWMDEVYQEDQESTDFFRFICCNDDFDLAEYLFNIKTKSVCLIRVIEEIKR